MSRRVIGCDRSKGKLYYLQIKQPELLKASVSTATADALDWHIRLGYPSLNKLKLVVPSLGSVIKVFRSDNALQYKSSLFQCFF